MAHTYTHIHTHTLSLSHTHTTLSLTLSLTTCVAAAAEAYSAIFIEFSSAKGKPEDYFKRSKAAVVRAIADWKALMGYLDMKV